MEDKLKEALHNIANQHEFPKDSHIEKIVMQKEKQKLINKFNIKRLSLTLAPVLILLAILPFAFNQDNFKDKSISSNETEATEESTNAVMLSEDSNMGIEVNMDMKIETTNHNYFSYSFDNEDLIIHWDDKSYYKLEKLVDKSLIGEKIGGIVTYKSFLNEDEPKDVTNYAVDIYNTEKESYLIIKINEEWFLYQNK